MAERDPRTVVMKAQWRDKTDGSPTEALREPDRRDGSVYHLTRELEVAIQVACVTCRPLLLRGDPGTGKSSLAAYLARNLGWRYYEHVVTARTEARDLLYTYDAVRRLADAQTSKTDTWGRPSTLDPKWYVEPGVFWWAIHRESAQTRGLGELPEGCRPPLEPNADVNLKRGGDPDRDGAVVLIDEIDKADPDVPNSLLVALGSNRFEIAETGQVIQARDPGNGGDAFTRLLVIITTNEERELPRAFLRRCVPHVLSLPDGVKTADEGRAAFLDYLGIIAQRHRQRDGVKDTDEEKALAKSVAEQLFDIRGKARHQRLRPPGTAEYLDALRACRELRIGPQSGEWKLVERLTFRKHD